MLGVYATMIVGGFSIKILLKNIANTKSKQNKFFLFNCHAGIEINKKIIVVSRVVICAANN